MLTYIFLNVNECWLTSSMPQQMFKLQISLNYVNIKQNVFFWGVADGNVSFNLVGCISLCPYHIVLDGYHLKIEDLCINVLWFLNIEMA